MLEKRTENSSENRLNGWYKSSERCIHPHPKKHRVECSLDEDVIAWLKSNTEEEEEYQIYINHFLRKIMNEMGDSNDIVE
jgi:uncharacterized protein (DUF4415 family)